MIADTIVVGGSLFTVGMLADLALLDGDIFAAPAEVIAAPRVEQTYVGGRLVCGSDSCTGERVNS